MSIALDSLPVVVRDLAKRFPSVTALTGGGQVAGPHVEQHAIWL